MVVEYDGTGFHGWQKQPGVSSIQGEIEIAISKFTKKNIPIYAASRTDAGVHAHGQVIHFDINHSYSEDKIRSAINHFLKPKKISILSVNLVSPEFHARFSKKKKFYVYKILNRIPPPTLLQNRAWHIKTTLNLNNMRKAAQHLIGHHDFSSFRASKCQAFSPIKTIDNIQIDKLNNQILIHFNAESFLYNQVRIMVGTIKKFGEKALHHTLMEKILHKKDRTFAFDTAPSHGLYLDSIVYDHTL